MASGTLKYGQSADAAEAPAASGAPAEVEAEVDFSLLEKLGEG